MQDGTTLDTGRASLLPEADAAPRKLLGLTNITDRKQAQNRQRKQAG